MAPHGHVAALLVNSARLIVGCARISRISEIIELKG